MTAGMTVRFETVRFEVVQRQIRSTMSRKLTGRNKNEPALRKTMTLMER